MEHEAAYKLLESYAYGTLNREEMNDVETHLGERCDVCLERLRDVSELSLNLARSLPRREPPPLVKNQLMNKIRSNRAAPLPRRRTASRGWIGWVVSAVATAVVVLLLVWTSVLQKEIRGLHENLTEARKAVDTVQKDVAPGKDGSIVLNKPGIHFVDMAGTDSNPQTFGKAVIDPDKRTAAVYMYNLPATPEGMEYQLWMLRDDTPLSAGVFEAGRDGTAMIEVNAIPDPSKIAAFQVTVEPTGGLSEPTGAIYLRGANLWRTVE